MQYPRTCRDIIPTLLLFLCGCGGKDPNLPELVSVTGTVTLDEKPLSGAQVSFIPVGSTKGTGSSGRTAADGKYILQAQRGGTGAAVGEYKVVISKLVMPDGSDFPANSTRGPMDSPAKETLPPIFSDPERTALRRTVPPGGGIIDFPLKAAKR